MSHTAIGIISFGVAGLILLTFALMDTGGKKTRTYSPRRPRYSTKHIRQEAWRAEQASARIFTEGHRRMMDAAFRFDWTKHFDWTKWYE